MKHYKNQLSLAPQKANHPTLDILTRIRSFHYFTVLTRFLGHGSTIRPFCLLGNDALSPLVIATYEFCLVIFFVDFGPRAPLSQNG